MFYIVWSLKLKKWRMKSLGVSSTMWIIMIFPRRENKFPRTGDDIYSYGSMDRGSLHPQVRGLLTLEAGLGVPPPGSHCLLWQDLFTQELPNWIQAPQGQLPLHLPRDSRCLAMSDVFEWNWVFTFHTLQNSAHSLSLP